MEEQPKLENKENQEDPLEDVLNSIMTAEEYAEMGRHEVPYIFELNKGDKELYYFGSPHIRGDAENPVIEQIQNAFKDANPDMVFVEGVRIAADKDSYNKRLKAATKEQLITTLGESGVAMLCAVEKGIDWYCPEPSDKDAAAYLLERGFSKEEIFAYEVLQMIPQYNGVKGKENISTFEKYVQSTTSKHLQTGKILIIHM